MQPVATRSRSAWTTLAAFYALACAISWTAHALSTPPAAQDAAGLLSDPLELVAKFGPSIAGLAMALALRRPLGGGAGPAPALPAQITLLLGAGLLLPLLMTALAAAAGLSFDGSGAEPPDAPVGQLAFEAARWIGLRTLLGGGLGEELGFRAFALPLLLTRMGPRAASLVIGLAWGLWHAPVLVAQPPLVWIAQLVFTIGLSLLFSWLYLRSGGSILLMVLLHGAVNGWADVFEAAFFPQLDGHTVWQVARILLYAGLGAALCLTRWPRAAGR
jgi:membrane protease YdiL (CAAX protease family)